MPLVYDFKFSPEYSGQSAVVRDGAGATVSGSPVALDSSGAASLSLDEGNYRATVSNAPLGLNNAQTDGVLNLADSIEEGGGGVGASETAYFVATGPIYSTDGNGSAGAFNFEADDRHDALPSWASINGDGDITLTEDAGTVAYSFAGAFDYDFSEASAVPAAPGTLSAGAVGKADGITFFNLSDPGVEGNGNVLQASNTTRAGGLVAASVISILTFPYASDDEFAGIPDGTATPRVAFTLTRVAQAAVLPD